MIIKTNALFAFTSASDQTAKEGYFVDADGVLIADASARPYGVITDGGDTDQNTTVARPTGYAGTVSVKIAASTTTIVKGTRLQLTSNGTLKAAVGTGRVVAVAEEAAVANELTEATLIPAEFHGGAFVLVDADGATITADQSGGFISNLGAVGAAVFALPAAVPGLRFTAIVEAAQELRLDPNGTETIALPSTGVQGAAGKYLTANAVGENVALVCLTAGTWSVISYAGTWTAEA